MDVVTDAASYECVQVISCDLHHIFLAKVLIPVVSLQAWICREAHEQAIRGLLSLAHILYRCFKLMHFANGCCVILYHVAEIVINYP